MEEAVRDESSRHHFLWSREYEEKRGEDTRRDDNRIAEKIREQKAIDETRREYPR